jgi:hypothetical protein
LRLAAGDVSHDLTARAVSHLPYYGFTAGFAAGFAGGFLTAAGGVF